MMLAALDIPHKLCARHSMAVCITWHWILTLAPLQQISIHTAHMTIRAYSGLRRGEYSNSTPYAFPYSHWAWCRCASALESRCICWLQHWFWSSFCSLFIAGMAAALPAGWACRYDTLWFSSQDQHLYNQAAFMEIALFQIPSTIMLSVCFLSRILLHLLLQLTWDCT